MGQLVMFSKQRKTSHLTRFIQPQLSSANKMIELFEQKLLRHWVHLYPCGMNEQFIVLGEELSSVEGCPLGQEHSRPRDADHSLDAKPAWVPTSFAARHDGARL
jgi:hypothetical protein